MPSSSYASSIVCGLTWSKMTFKLPHALKRGKIRLRKLCAVDPCCQVVLSPVLLLLRACDPPLGNEPQIGGVVAEDVIEGRWRAFRWVRALKFHNVAHDGVQYFPARAGNVFTSPLGFVLLTRGRRLNGGRRAPSSPRGSRVPCVPMPGKQLIATIRKSALRFLLVVSCRPTDA